MTHDLGDAPAPLTPADCDLRDFSRIMIDVNRLFGSSFNAKASRDPLAWMIGHKLWYRSWHQVPAASLPDDDDELCYLAELGFDRVSWDNTKTLAMHGWIKCSDGRLYHPVVAEAARDAWDRKLRKRYNTECARIKKHNQRHGASVPFPDFDAFISSGCKPADLSPGTFKDVPRDVPKMSTGKTPPRETKGKGQGHSNTALTGEAAKRGTRLPDDFVMPDEWISAAMEKRRITRAVAEREAEKFTLHFQAASGSTAKKVNWRLAWLKWSASIAPDRSRHLSNEGREYLGV